MQDFEKLGVFYLGKKVDPATGMRTEDLVLFDSKDLATHAVCVGMTGSGKTGMGITLLEEAGIDKIPAIVIDPKGDLGNLLLTFPHLSAEEFQPWIDSREAEKKGMDVPSYAKEVASTWQKGLAEWGENAERIQKFRNGVELAIYTPASNAGTPLSILNSFSVPSKVEMLDVTQLRERIATTTSSLLGLLGISADPLKSREHLLLSSLISNSWESGKEIDIPSLIQQIINPPFSKIGVLDLETVYPAKERMELAISLNHLLASPAFQAWMEGEPLDIKRLLYTEEGKPKISVISIAHLSDPERMFFVTLLLNEFIDWMRLQEGTSSLRALLYMDEIFGFFPPTAMPPSKLPMLTLLKQARAFGVGVILVTQNPVDLDYKGLSNCGTWFIGKLQTERDKARILEGLNTASNGELDQKTLNTLMAMTGNRTFLMRSIHEKDPILFQTRWTLSYLRGPMTLAQIASLTDKSSVPEVKKSPLLSSKKMEAKPTVPPGIEEYFVNSASGPTHYQPKILAMARVHFVNAKNKVDLWRDLSLVFPMEEGATAVSWEKGTALSEQLEKTPSQESSYEELPAEWMREKTYLSYKKSLVDVLYQNETLSIFLVAKLSMTSSVGETQGDFKVRVLQALREKRDAGVNTLRAKYSEKIAAITNKLGRAQNALAEKQQQAGRQKWETVISVGTTLLGTIFGRGVTKGTISQAGTSLRRAGQIGKDSGKVTEAAESIKNYQQQLDTLESDLQREVAAISTESDPEKIAIETVAIHPKKADISVEKIALLWWATSKLDH